MSTQITLDTPPDFMTIREAAAALGIGERQARRYAGLLGHEDRRESETGPARVRLSALSALRREHKARPDTAGHTTGPSPTYDRTPPDSMTEPSAPAALPALAERLLAEKDARIADLQRELKEQHGAAAEMRRLLLSATVELQELRRLLPLPAPGGAGLMTDSRPDTAGHMPDSSPNIEDARKRPESDQEHPAGPKDSPESERPAAASVATGHPTITPAPTPTEGASGTELQEGPTAPTAKRVPWWRFRLR
jgi:hypothetical protein